MIYLFWQQVVFVLFQNLQQSSDYSKDFQVQRNGPDDTTPITYRPGPTDDIVGPVTTSEGKENLMVIIIACTSGGVLLILIGCLVFYMVVRYANPSSSRHNITHVYCLECNRRNQKVVQISRDKN